MNSLQSMTQFLNAHGWNYTVFLECYGGPRYQGESLEENVGRLIGASVVLEDLGEVGEPEIVAEITECLSFVGSHAEGVESELVKGEEFRQLLSSVLNYVVRLARESKEVRSIRLTDGHPAYPVFWEFAFVFSGATESVALVGSSSD